jgi:hypothetical protein
MSEAAGREQMERRLAERSLHDDAFRRRLLEEPKRTVEEELGTRLPEGVRVVAVEETAQTIYLRLPSASPLGEGGELSDRSWRRWPVGAPGLTRPARAATPAFAPSRFALRSSLAQRSWKTGQCLAASATPTTWIIAPKTRARRVRAIARSGSPRTSKRSSRIIPIPRVSYRMQGAFQCPP